MHAAWPITISPARSHPAHSLLSTLQRLPLPPDSSNSASDAVWEALHQSSSTQYPSNTLLSSGSTTLYPKGRMVQALWHSSQRAISWFGEACQATRIQQHLCLALQAHAAHAAHAAVFSPSLLHVVASKGCATLLLPDWQRLPQVGLRWCERVKECGRVCECRTRGRAAVFCLGR